MVSKVTLPESGAVQQYQIECPPTLPAWFGSPVSLVAARLLPVTEPLEPPVNSQTAKLSLLGSWLRVTVALPLAPFLPSTAMR